MSGDTYLDTEVEAGAATGPAAAAVIDAVTETLREAPGDRRYNIYLEVNEYKEGSA